MVEEIITWLNQVIVLMSLLKGMPTLEFNNTYDETML